MSWLVDVKPELARTVHLSNDQREMAPAFSVGRQSLNWQWFLSNSLELTGILYTYGG